MSKQSAKNMLFEMRNCDIFAEHLADIPYSCSDNAVLLRDSISAKNISFIAIQLFKFTRSGRKSRDLWVL